MNEFWYKPALFYGISRALMLDVADVFMGRQVFQGGCTIFAVLFALCEGSISPRAPHLLVLATLCAVLVCNGG